jgi:hypothetical protein
MVEIGNHIHVVMESVTDEWERTLNEVADKTGRAIWKEHYTERKGRPTPKRTTPPKNDWHATIVSASYKRKRQAKNRVAKASRRANRHKR